MESEDDRIVISYGGWRAMLPTLGAVTVCVVLGGAGLVGGLTTDQDGRVPAMVIGSILLVVGLAMILGLRVTGRRKQLVFTADAVHWNGPGDREWTLPWDRISRIRVHLSDVRTRRATVYVVRLIIAPTDLTALLERTPELSGLRGDRDAAVDELTLTLGHARQVVPDLLRALERFAGAANGGLLDLTTPADGSRRRRE